MDFNLTDAAIEAVANQITHRGGGCLRVGIRGGGCSGFAYQMEFHDGPPNPRDIMFNYLSKDSIEVKILIDPKSLVYLTGSTLDFEKTLTKQGFKFINPLEASKCGCGTSFSVK